MGREYRVKSTSRATADVEDIALGEEAHLTKDEPTRLTRRILRLQLVDNKHSDTARVRGRIMHQRRHKKTEPWADAASFNLAHLKAGEEVRLDLSADEMERLFNALRDMYAATVDGVPQTDRTLVVVDKDATYIATGHEREAIEQLVTQDRFWDVVDELKPDVLEAIARGRLQAERRRAYSLFEEELQRSQWSEKDWEHFFGQNPWIFGHGLAYQFLSEVEGQAHYGGKDLTGVGGQQGDFLMATEAMVRFTVLVDIKKPDTPLLSAGPYRNRAYPPSGELAGGVAQLQSNCRTWVTQGALQEQNRALLEEQGVYTYEPKGILVAGHTAQLTTRDQKASFELYRRHTTNPEILTFDELLWRARFLVDGQH